MSDASPTFYLSSLAFTDGVLTLHMSDGRQPLGALTFGYVRSFVFVKESDFWAAFEAAEKSLVQGMPSDAPRVRRIGRGALAQSFLTRELVDEDPMIFFVWTPDECFEVVGFEDPRWEPIPTTDL